MTIHENVKILTFNNTKKLHTVQHSCHTWNVFPCINHTMTHVWRQLTLRLAMVISSSSFWFDWSASLCSRRARRAWSLRSSLPISIPWFSATLSLSCWLIIFRASLWRWIVSKASVSLCCSRSNWWCRRRTLVHSYCHEIDNLHGQTFQWHFLTSFLNFVLWNLCVWTKLELQS